MSNTAEITARSIVRTLFPPLAFARSRSARRLLLRLEVSLSSLLIYAFFSVRLVMLPCISPIFFVRSSPCFLLASVMVFSWAWSESFCSLLIL